MSADVTDHRRNLQQMADEFNRQAPTPGAEPKVKLEVAAPDGSCRLFWDPRERRFVVR